MIKWTKALLATIVSFLICYYGGKFSGFDGFTFAWILNFLLMAWFTYIDSIFIGSIIPYFDTRTFERDGLIYTNFGVNFYRKLLVWVGWEKLNKKNNEITSKRSSLQQAIYRSKSSETGHTIIFLIVTLVTILVAGSLREALWLVILNLLLNVYPVFV